MNWYSAKVNLYHNIATNVLAGGTPMWWRMQNVSGRCRGGCRPESLWRWLLNVGIWSPEPADRPVSAPWGTSCRLSRDSHLLFTTSTHPIHHHNMLHESFLIHCYWRQQPIKWTGDMFSPASTYISEAFLLINKIRSPRWTVYRLIYIFQHASYDFLRSACDPDSVLLTSGASLSAPCPTAITQITRSSQMVPSQD